jgi:predicted ATPase/DNA-binding XRE family transcriptional regulator
MDTKSDTNADQITKEISFGAWLRQHRRSFDLTQEALAEQVGCARITLRRIAADELKPSRELAEILLEKVNIPPTEREQWVRFARGLAGLPSAALSTTETRPPTNLPALLTSFIGREMELAEIQTLLQHSRLLTLIGTGGIGKTRLSIQAAHHMLDAYVDGTWLVEFAPILDPLLVARTTAVAIGLPDDSQRPVMDRLCDYLREKEMLLILDNCEHLVVACAQLAERILQAAPRVCILASSREALGIGGEVTYRVPSLGLPDRDQLPALESLSQYEAVRLFIDRAISAKSSFTVTNGNAPALAQICHRLDGIPLAIELAAAKIRVLSLEQIAHRLDDRFRLLTGGSRTALERHQTLRAAIDWSYDLLPTPEQILFRRLSVYIGGWSLAAAESVCGDVTADDDVQRDDVLNLIEQLVNKSLLLVEEAKGEARYQMLETVRQYAAEKFLGSGEAERILNRHLSFFLMLAEEADANFHGRHQNVWLDRLETEHGNLTAALGWSITPEALAKPEPVVEAGLRLTAALFWFWRVRGYVAVGRKWLEMALIASESPTIVQGEIARQTRGIILRGLGWLSGLQGDFRTDYLEARLASFQELDDKKAIGKILNNLGGAAEMQGDFAHARQLLEESLALRRAIGNNADLIEILVDLGRVIMFQGDHKQAKALFDEGLVLAEALEDLWFIVYARQHLGFVALFSGDTQEALTLFRSCLVHFPHYNDKLYLTYILWGVAETAAVRGESVLSARLFGAAESLSEKIGWAIPPGHRPLYDFFVTALRAQLDQTALAAAWAEGRAMALERAIAYALEQSRT